MTPTHNVLLLLAILGFFVKVSVATEVNNSPQIKNNEQIKSCVVGNDYSFSRGFLEDFGIETGNFENIPTDVKCFIEDAATCQHFAGEEVYDKERKKEIVDGLKEYCTAAQNQMKILKKKYVGRADVLKIITICEKKGLDPWEETICATFDPSQIIED
jgi:hypothetical protein